MDYEAALSRLAQVRIVEYSLRPEVAQEMGLSEEARHKVGVIAQELAEVLPDAVREDGDYLTVDDVCLLYFHLCFSLSFVQKNILNNGSFIESHILRYGCCGEGVVSTDRKFGI